VLSSVQTPYGPAEIEPGYFDGGIHIACGAVRCRRPIDQWRRDFCFMKNFYVFTGCSSLILVMTFVLHELCKWLHEPKPKLNISKQTEPETIKIGFDFYVWVAYNTTVYKPAMAQASYQTNVKIILTRYLTFYLYELLRRESKSVLTDGLASSCHIRLSNSIAFTTSLSFLPAAWHTIKPELA
jgi:hypothetical protein